MSERESPYNIVRGSDEERDGYFVELTREESGSQEIILEVFRSDVDGRVTFRAFAACEMSFSLVEEFFDIARAELTPSSGRPNGP